MQRGNNVYLSGGPFSGIWFEYMGTGSGTGNDSYKVHWPDHLDAGTNETRKMLEYFGVPYNDVWTEGTGIYGIKVPGGVLLDKNWPWSSKLGYPTQYDTVFWVWEEGGERRIASEAEYNAWIQYIDVQQWLTDQEKRDFYNGVYRELFEYSEGDDFIDLTDKYRLKWLDDYIRWAAGDLANFMEEQRPWDNWRENDLIAILRRVEGTGFSMTVNYQMSLTQQEFIRLIQEFEEHLNSITIDFNKIWFLYWGYYYGDPLRNPGGV